METSLSTVKYYPDYAKIKTSFAVMQLAEKARELGIQFKIDGFPFGASRDVHQKTFGLPPLPRGETTCQTLGDS